MATIDLHNVIAHEGCDRCACGSKYWEHDHCVDCGAPVRDAFRALEPADLVDEVKRASTDLHAAQQTLHATPASQPAIDRYSAAMDRYNALEHERQIRVRDAMRSAPR